MQILKKTILILILSGISVVKAQGPVNAGFESWTNFILFFEPQGFVSTNYASVILGTGGLPTANVSRSTQIKRSGTYAAKLNSYGSSPSDSIGIPGAMVTGSLDLANVSIVPGFAYTGRPAELRAWTQYSPSTLLPDSGIISVVFTKYDPLAGPLNVIGAGFGVINASSNFQELVIPIFYIGNDTPDTAIIVISTSSSFSFDTADFVNAPVGSVLYIDDMSFTGTALGVERIEDLLQAQISPNPNDGNFKIQFVQQQSAEVELRMIDAMGKLVYSEKRFFETGLQQFTLTEGNLAAGMYWLEISNGTSVARKLMSLQ